MKLKITVLATLILTALNVLAITIKWDVDAADARAKIFTAYHGETLTFVPAFRSDGAVLSNVTASTIYYQTNGMGSAWWSTDGLTFAPSNDVGATSYRFFISAADPTGTVYRANGTLRMLASPGYSPNALTLPRETIDFAAIDVSNAPWATTDDIPTDAHITNIANAAASTKADASTVDEIEVKVNEANGYSRSTYNYVAGATNAWFQGTNYVTGANITNKYHFAFETGMNLLTMPCSMALMENRDGQKGVVWDQRDWVAWYWSFKSAQMMSQINASNDVLRAEMAAPENHKWAKYYGSTGRANPDPTTTYIDTPRVCLSPGMAWETVAEVGGAAYWTIVGDGAVIGGSGTNATLVIKDFEGNPVITITKGAHSLAWVSKDSMTNQMFDALGRVCFDILANVQPVAYFSVTLDQDDFVVETDEDCPAQYLWEQITAPTANSSGVYRVHFLLKPGIVSTACFAKFLVEIQGETQVKYSAPANIESGLFYGTHKIAPVIPANAQVGDTITWKVVQ